MKNSKLLILIVLLLVFTILLGYRGFTLNNELESAKATIDSVRFSEFVNLSNSIQEISDELMDYDNENKLYLSKLDREGARLNQIGMNLHRLLNNDLGYYIYEEGIFKIERFVRAISRNSLIDKEKIQQIAKIMDQQQNKLHDIFFEEQIGTSELNKEENIHRIISILNIITDEIERADLNIE